MTAVVDPWNGEERRAHRRSRPDHAVAVLFGQAWQRCEIIDVSQGGVAFRSDNKPPVDKEIIVRIADLGLFKCRVLRHARDGFAARFEAADFGAESWELSPLRDPPSERQVLGPERDRRRSGG